MPRGGARPGAGRPKGSVSIAPRIREALISALDELEEEGQPLSSILKRELLASPMQTLRVLASFEPRQKPVDDAESRVTLPDLLAQMDREDEETAEPAYVRPK